MRTTTSTLAALAVLLMQSCTDAPEQQADATPLADTISETPAAPVFEPFDVLQIGHTVKDYAVWKKAFDADSSARTASGLEFRLIGRNMENENDLLIFLNVADVAKAKAFAADPRLKDVMEKNGVTSKPEFHYMHMVRFNPDAKEKTRVMITHRVKDFDAWLKVYDSEGPAARAAEGLYDRALAQEIDDPNLVHIVFDVKDVAQAKASIGSDTKKALMMSAGVEAPPTITFYTQAE